MEKKETPEEAKKEIGLKIAQFVAVSAGTVILIGLGLFILFILAYGLGW